MSPGNYVYPIHFPLNTAENNTYHYSYSVSHFFFNTLHLKITFLERDKKYVCYNYAYFTVIVCVLCILRQKQNEKYNFKINFTSLKVVTIHTRAHNAHKPTVDIIA